jgi:hypothetical protein
VFPCRIRVQVANRLATNAFDWHDYFYPYNSGTYNNQWMVRRQVRACACVCVCAQGQRVAFCGGLSRW